MSLTPTSVEPASLRFAPINPAPPVTKNTPTLATTRMRGKPLPQPAGRRNLMLIVLASAWEQGKNSSAGQGPRTRGNRCKPVEKGLGRRRFMKEDVKHV